ncbi:MAG: hypothetical protein ACP5VP_00990 [Candidatus Limnocylindrales bacterium]
MPLTRLLAEAAAAPPDRRIEWRDQIAPFGRQAIEGVRPWLADGALAAFAIRVIWRVGERGEPAAAVKALRGARSRLPAHLQSDVDWAVRALGPAVREAAANAPEAPAPRASALRTRQRPA